MILRKKLPVFVSLIMIFLLMALSACGFGKASASVKDNRIELDGAALDFGGNTVPDSSETTLTALKVKEKEKPEGLASTLYELELDMTCTAPVTISIPFEEGDAPEDDAEAVPMLGLGNDLTLADGSVNTLYTYVPAQVGDGVVTASFIPAEYLEELSVNGASGSANPSREHLRLGIFWCSTTFVDGGHFLVYFPAQMHTAFISYNDRSALLSDLEGVYNEYLNKGYVYAKRSSWPIEVNIQSLDAMGYYSYGWNGAEGKIYLNRSLFEGGYQANAVKPLIAHEFFHFVQLNYVGSGDDNPWFDEATATYFEGQKGGGIPSIVAEYNEKIFSGVFPEENDAANGYARMPLIQYLSQSRGESFILNAYTIAGEGADWDSALLSSIGPPAGWAADFYEALVKGDVGSYAPYTLYSNLAGNGLAGIGTSLALQIPTEEEIAVIMENDEIPSLGETTVSVGPYGAQLVALTIDEKSLSRVKEGNDPTVSVAGADLRVFAVRGSTVTVLPSSGESVKIGDFKELCENQYVFLALVTGLHASGKQDYTLKVELAPSPTLDELVGTYEDGAITFTDVYISPEYRASAAADDEEETESDDELGCDIDIDIIGALDALKGQTQQRRFMISKTGEETGTIAFYDEDGEDPTDPIPFTYLNGNLIFDYEIEGATIDGNLLAAYGTNRDVTIDGDLSMKLGEDIRIDLHIAGSKPLGVE
ncbi:MAG TPA: hypothetical protein PLU75_08250 [Oscillospiraceae bacterium]|nr:hypothetical protein [Oscillospiraceae bacterium]HRW56285.1 hypothetical protein [Oscillospiraceae bacterium]